MNWDRIEGNWKQFKGNALQQWERGRETACRLGEAHDSGVETAMIYSIAIILVLLWLVGLMSSATLGGFIHVLLVIAVIMVLLRIIAGRKLI
jgi:hypothetical protein